MGCCIWFSEQRRATGFHCLFVGSWDPGGGVHKCPMGIVCRKRYEWDCLYAATKGRRFYHVWCHAPDRTRFFCRDCFKMHSMQSGCFIRFFGISSFTNVHVRGFCELHKSEKIHQIRVAFSSFECKRPFTLPRSSAGRLRTGA